MIIVFLGFIHEKLLQLEFDRPSSAACPSGISGVLL